MLCAALVASVGLAGCTAENPASAPTTTTAASATPIVSARLDPETCRETPDSGHIERGGHDLRFGHGGIRIAVSTPSATVAAAPSSAVAAADATCYGFTRWGPAAPDVPPDSLLFVFKGQGDDGAQIDFLASELTGGVLPPIGSNRPSVGPMTGAIPAQIGASVGGTYYRASNCPLTIVALSSQRAAAHFICPTATRSDTDPLAPDDDVTYDADESATSSSAPMPPAIGAPSGVSLSGWFELTP